MIIVRMAWSRFHGRLPKVAEVFLGNQWPLFGIKSDPAAPYRTHSLPDRTIVARACRDPIFPTFPEII